MTTSLCVDHSLSLRWLTHETFDVVTWLSETEVLLWCRNSIHACHSLLSGYSVRQPSMSLLFEMPLTPFVIAKSFKLCDNRTGSCITTKSSKFLRVRQHKETFHVLFLHIKEIEESYKEEDFSSKEMRGWLFVQKSIQTTKLQTLGNEAANRESWRMEKKLRVMEDGEEFENPNATLTESRLSSTSESQDKWEETTDIPLLNHETRSDIRWNNRDMTFLFLLLHSLIIDWTNTHRSETVVSPRKTCHMRDPFMVGFMPKTCLNTTCSKKGQVYHMTAATNMPLG